MQTFSDIAKKYVWALNGLIGKHKNKRKITIYFIWIWFNYCGCV